LGGGVGGGGGGGAGGELFIFSGQLKPLTRMAFGWAGWNGGPPPRAGRRPNPLARAALGGGTRGGAWGRGHDFRVPRLGRAGGVLGLDVGGRGKAWLGARRATQNLFLMD